MQLQLSGKIALVTGAGRGIGKAIALKLAESGADIIINYSRSESEALEVAAEIEKLGRRCATIQADISKVAECARLIAESTSRLGRLDILVNNAGVSLDAPFMDVTEEDYDKVLDINLKGTFFCSQAFAKYCKAAKIPGKIINVSSVHEEIPFPGHAAYCASKGAIRMLTRNLSIELAEFDITINSVAPGAIDTDINRSLDRDPEKKKALLAQIPLRRLGSPQEIGSVATFLASESASYVTGSTYFVDGGLTWFYKE